MKEANEDYKRIMQLIIDFGKTDYIKLQHPKNRDKKYLEETFLTSVDMFFNDNFRFMHFKNDDESNMSLNNLLSASINNLPASNALMRKYLVEESVRYWWEKNFYNLIVPKFVCFSGLVFFVIKAKEYSVCFKENIIYLPVKDKQADRLFSKACLDILLYLSDIELESNKLQEFNKNFYLFLKVNNCFSKDI